MATIALGFNISASATGMAQGVNAAAVELEKLGYAAKKAASDVGVLKTLSIGQAFVNGIQTVYSTFSGLTSSTLQAVESTANLSRELGISYGQLQELQIAAQLAGVSTDSLAKAFTKAQVTITKAAQGGKEAVQALSAIGLSAADFQGLSSSEQFTLIASAINQITDPAQRAAAAVAIFGRSGAELLPVFRELGGNLQQSQELLAKFGGGISEEEKNLVLSLGDAWDKVGISIGLFAEKLLAALTPALADVANSLVNWLAELSNSQAVISTAQSVVSGFVGVLQLGYNIASAISPIFAAISQAIAFIGENGRGAAVGLSLAVSGLIAYQVATAIATIATIGFSGAIKALLASTGIGLLLVVLGTVGGALLEWATKADDAGKAGAAAAAGVGQSSADAIAQAQKLASGTSQAVKDAFKTTEDEAKKAADAAKKAAEAARREADQAIQRLVTEQQFGGDSQRYAAAQAVKAIEEDIRNTEAEITAARAAGDQAAIDAGTQRIAQLDQALAREQEIASGARKAAQERAKLEAELGKQRVKFEEQIAAAFRKPTDPLKLEDVRSVSGYEALQRFSQDQSQDPALEEYRKQLKELQAIRRELAKNDQPETVDILGG